MKHVLPISLLVLFSGLSSSAFAQPKLKVGESYFFLGETAVKRSASDGSLAEDATTHNAPFNSICRLVDTLAAGEAVIRFWKWPKDDSRRTEFNYTEGDSAKAAYYFLLPKASTVRLKEQNDRSPRNGQRPIDAPSDIPETDEYWLLDTNRLSLGRDRSFVYSIGTNFDFIETVQTAKTYHDLRVWIPRLTKAETGCLSRLGFEFGFNRFRTFSTPDSATSEYRDVRGTQVINGADTTFVISYLTNTVKDKINSRFDNIGLMFNPMFRLSGHDRKDVLFALIGDFEWQRSVLDRTITRTYNEVSTGEAPDSWDAPYALNYGDLPAPEEHFRTTTDNFYGGGGIRLMYRDDFGTLNLRMATGYAYTMITPGDSKSLEASEGMFYALQAEIIESRVSGVKIGTEIRGFFVDDPQDPLRAMPRFSLYIAKEFQLKKIGELLSTN